MFLDPHCGELFFCTVAIVGNGDEYRLNFVYVGKGISYFDKLSNEKESFLH